MTLAILIILAALFSLVVIVGVAASRSLLPSGQNLDCIQPVDLAAFRNLIDPAENEYLRRRLPAREFRRVQRKRLRAADAYVQTAARNAAFLVRMGQMALSSADAPTATAARQLVDEALLLRRNAAFVLLRIYVALAWPTAGFAAAPILDGYNRVAASAMLLGRLQAPSVPVRISASS
jgi:hypothetical protein